MCLVKSNAFQDSLGMFPGLSKLQHPQVQCNRYIWRTGNNIIASDGHSKCMIWMVLGSTFPSTPVLSSPKIHVTYIVLILNAAYLLRPIAA